MKGIDLSNYQRNDYKRFIDEADTEFVICRAAWRFMVDPMCDVMYQYAKAKGKKLGVYFFPLPSDGEAAVHAEWAYKQVLGYINEAIIALDWEAYNGGEGKLDPSAVYWAREWLNKFYELSGVRPMIYMNSNCNSLYDWSSVVQGNYGLWIANYGNNSGYDYGRPPVKYWANAAIHQFTSLGDQGRGLDRDTFYGDVNAWDKYAQSNKTQTADKPAPSIPPKTYTEDEVKVLIETATSDYQNRLNEQLMELKQTKEYLGVCEKKVNDFKSGLEGILNGQ